MEAIERIKNETTYAEKIFLLSFLSGKKMPGILLQKRCNILGLTTALAGEE